MKSKIRSLKQTPIFSALSGKSLKKIASFAKLKLYRKHEIIFRKGDPANDLFVLKSGLVKIFLSNQDGKEIILTVIHKNNFFGILSLFDCQLRSAFVSAVEDCEAMIICKQDFFSVLMEHPEVVFKLMRYMSHGFRKGLEKIEDLTFLDSYGKTAKLLLKLAAWQGHNQMGYHPDVQQKLSLKNKVSQVGYTTKKRKRTGEKVILNVPFTRKEMAAMAGITRETLNRMFNEFQKRGCLKVEGKKITIFDETILRREVLKK